MAPGEIYRRESFYFDEQTGEPRRKYFVVLALLPSGDVVARLLTSRAHGRPENPRCFHGHPYPSYFLGVPGAELGSKTWVDLRYLEDFDGLDVQREMQRGRVKLLRAADGACRSAIRTRQVTVCCRFAQTLNLDSLCQPIWRMRISGNSRPRRRSNSGRLPPDFKFQLTNQEVANLRSQFVTSSLSPGYSGRRYRPWAFTEQDVSMLSSALRSETAVRVNIEIMRAFVRLRRGAIVSGQIMALVEDLYPTHALNLT